VTALTAVQAIGLLLVVVLGTAVVATRDPRRQLFVLGTYGLAQGVLFFALGAPDVALSALVIGMLAMPAQLALVLARLERAPLRPADGR
jgi:uncharacterized MnhB-related membrane protein